MNIKNQRRMATEIMKCGSSRVWMSPEHEEEIKQSITKDDIRNLIGRGVIRLKQEQGISRGRARELASQKRKGLRRGKGSRKGKVGARYDSKRGWMERIRNLRELFKNLKEKKIISNETYRTLRNKSKGGLFRSRRHVILYLEEHDLFNKKK